MALEDSLNRTLERALLFRREKAMEAGHPAGNLDELITGIAFAPDAVRPSTRSGWLHIGRVFDSVIAEMLDVYWQPSTDRVQMDRPTDWMPITPPEIQHEPLVWVHAMGFWATDPAYDYFFAGREFGAAEAEGLINAAKTPDGWTWEPCEQASAAKNET